jgi:PAS domain S-box-containing protein
MNEIPKDDRASRSGDSFGMTGHFIDTLAEGVLLLDPTGEVIDCNRSSLELLGFDKESLMGASIRDLVGEAVREDGSTFTLEDDPANRILATGEPLPEAIIGIDLPGNARRWLRSNFSAIHEGGKITRVVVTFDDITDRIRQEHLLQLLLEVNRLMMLATKETDFLQSLCDKLVDIGGFALATIAFVTADDRGEVGVAHAAGLTDYLYDGMWSFWGNKDIGRGPTGTALRIGSTQVANDVAHHPSYGPWRERAEQFGLGSSIALPFASGTRRAVLCVYDRHSFAFDDGVVQGLEAIAREAEFCATHVRLLGHLQVALGGTLTALGHTLKYFDPFTGGHQINVTSLSAAIATHIGLDSKMIELIRQAAEVHDLGKISIPHDVLASDQLLSNDGLEEFRRHTEVGYEILKNAGLPWPLAEVALQHHERMDGSGYPYGLPGSEICLPARIVAVADVVEALSHPRPYREGISLQKALEFLAEGSGSLFDEELVEACHAVFASGYGFEPNAYEFMKLR